MSLEEETGNRENGDIRKAQQLLLLEKNSFAASHSKTFL